MTRSTLRLRCKNKELQVLVVSNDREDSEEDKIEENEGQNSPVGVDKWV